MTWEREPNAQRERVKELMNDFLGVGWNRGTTMPGAEAGKEDQATKGTNAIRRRRIWV